MHVTLRGKNTLPGEVKIDILKRRNQLSLTWGAFFPFRVNPFSGKQTGNHKSCVPCTKTAENLPSVSSPFI